MQKPRKEHFLRPPLVMQLEYCGSGREKFRHVSIFSIQESVLCLWDATNLYFSNIEVYLLSYQKTVEALSRKNFRLGSKYTKLFVCFKTVLHKQPYSTAEDAGMQTINTRAQLLQSTLINNSVWKNKEQNTKYVWNRFYSWAIHNLQFIYIKGVGKYCALERYL